MLVYRRWADLLNSDNGKWPVSFKPSTRDEIYDYGKDYVMYLPCGKCMGCKVDRAIAWTFRNLVESIYHESSLFLTLTYDDMYLPDGNTLRYRDFQLFMKRLRKHFSNEKFRFFMCGEYNSSGNRLFNPHYHAIIYGLKLDDMYFFKQGSRSRIFISPTIADLWPYGYHTINYVHPANIAYCSQYTFKKIEDKQYYGNRVRPFVKMSNRPGIGFEFYDENKEQLFELGYAQLQGGRKLAIPKYYREKCKIDNPDLYNIYEDKLLALSANKFYTKLKSLDPFLFDQILSQYKLCEVDLLTQLEELRYDRKVAILLDKYDMHLGNRETRLIAKSDLNKRNF